MLSRPGGLCFEEDRKAQGLQVSQEADTVCVSGEKGPASAGTQWQVQSWFWARKITRLDGGGRRGQGLVPDPWPCVCSANFVVETLYVHCMWREAWMIKIPRSLTPVALTSLSPLPNPLPGSCPAQAVTALSSGTF